MLDYLLQEFSVTSKEELFDYMDRHPTDPRVIELRMLFEAILTRGLIDHEKAVDF